MLQAADSAAPPPLRLGTAVQPLPLLAGVSVLAVGAIRLAEGGWRPPLLWLLGLLLGATLYHASFGFASAYRRMIVARDMRGVQAQLLLLALGTALFAPVLAAGEVFGQAVGGAWAPVGLSVAAGAFLFGVGMQLAGGCGSGTLYTGDQTRPAQFLEAEVAMPISASMPVQGSSAIQPIAIGTMFLAPKCRMALSSLDEQTSRNLRNTGPIAVSRQNH